MKVLDHLASASGRRNEVPNKELAQRLVKSKDEASIKILVKNLSNPDKNIQGDCIKVLYEIGKQNPALIAQYVKEFGFQLDSTNNRMTWGAMTALDAIVSFRTKEIFKMLPKILAVAETGTVITRDHAVAILSGLGSKKEYAAVCYPLLIEQLTRCPEGQFPMYAEKTFPLVNKNNKKEFLGVIESRITNLGRDSRKARVKKLLNKLPV
jgi:hypothetical protein